MRPIVNPQLVNGPYGDPGLYVDFLFERRALLFDLGELGALGPRKLLRLTHVFVTHTHMDHFIGFDTLLRVCLGRDACIEMTGPPGFADRVEHRLAGYTWNLVENYAGSVEIRVTELHPDGRALRARFACQRRFRREPLQESRIEDGIVVEEAAFRVRAAFLDHGVPCLGYALEEKEHVNVWKNRLAERGLPVGAWLRDLKLAVLRSEPDSTPIRAWWRESGEIRERVLPLGELKAGVLRIVPGQKICYVTDVAGTPGNAERIVDLARGANILYIEAVFLEADAEIAARKLHLTARGAGEIARAAGVKTVIPFHFSPRYLGREPELRAELEAAFRG
ncbi:MAG: MBL fold metallo-hydrolase [Gammaproteobacteria bacterium]